MAAAYMTSHVKKMLSQITTKIFESNKVISQPFESENQTRLTNCVEQRDSQLLFALVTQHANSQQCCFSQTNTARQSCRVSIRDRAVNQTRISLTLPPGGKWLGSF